MNAQAVDLVQVPAATVVVPLVGVATVEELHEEIIRDATALQEAALEELTEEQQAQMEILVVSIGSHLQKLRLARREGLTET